MSDPFDYDIELRLLSQPRYLCVGRAAIGAAVAKLGYDESQCGQVMLAVDEALANVIRHGYEGRGDQPIWVRFRPLKNGDAGGKESGFTIVIEDRAKQVDPETIRSRDLDEIRPGGIGVHLIQQIMDEVEYVPRPDGGMRLTMTKHCNASNPSPSSGKPQA